VRVGLRISIVCFAVITVIVTAAAVHGPWHFASQANTREMVKQLSDEIVAGVSREINEIFSSAIAAQGTLRRLLMEGAFNIEDRVKREPVFMSFLLANKHFSWVSFGKPNGDFYGARRRDDKNYRLVESIWDPGTRTADRQMMYLKTDGKGDVRPTVAKQRRNTYNATQRQWYKRAVAKPDTNVWTGVYIFASSGIPGLNSAITYRKDGEVVGVVSIAIELERISKYLGTIKSVRSGAAFIINRDGRMIAYKDKAEVTRKRSDSSRLELTPLSQTKSPMLKIASAALGAKDPTAKQKMLQLYTEPGSGKRYFVSLLPLAGQDWFIGTVIPESDFTAAIDANYIKLVAALAVALLLIALLAVWSSRRLFVRPLHRVIAQTDHIARFDLDKVRYIPHRIREIDALSASIVRMSTGLSSFRKFLPAALVQTLLKEGIVAEPVAQRRTVTIMFMDLQGFTANSEQLGHRIAPLLSDYLSAMSHVIHEHGGTIDKFIGDAVMAFWGAPYHNEEHATDACKAALSCLEAMTRLRKQWAEEGKPDMGLRIGINTGRVVVGNIGSEERLNYTVIGDPVNLASRLENANKEFGTSIMIGQHTWELVRYDMVTRKLDEVRLRGREQLVSIYELLDRRNEDGENPAQTVWIDEFETGLREYHAGKLAEAEVRFRRVKERRGDDPPSDRYLEMCATARTAQPDADSKSGVVSLRQDGGDALG